MRYLNECEFDIVGDLNNVENELQNMIVKYDFDFYDYDLCNRAHHPTHHSLPRLLPILLVVEIIFGILLKYAFVNEISENETENEIGLEFQLEFKHVNVNVSIDCSVYEYSPCPTNTNDNNNNNSNYVNYSRGGNYNLQIGLAPHSGDHKLSTREFHSDQNEAKSVGVGVGAVDDALHQHHSGRRYSGKRQSKSKSNTPPSESKTEISRLDTGNNGNLTSNVIGSSLNVSIKSSNSHSKL